MAHMARMTIHFVMRRYTRVIASVKAINQIFEGLSSIVCSPNKFSWQSNRRDQNGCCKNNSHEANWSPHTNTCLCHSPCSFLPRATRIALRARSIICRALIVTVRRGRPIRIVCLPPSVSVRVVRSGGLRFTAWCMVNWSCIIHLSPLYLIKSILRTLETLACIGTTLVFVRMPTKSGRVFWKVNKMIKLCLRFVPSVDELL